MWLSHECLVLLPSLDKNLELGDIILFSVNAKNEIETYTLEFRYKNGDVSSNVSSYNSYFTKYFGKTYVKKGSRFSLISATNNPNYNTSWEYLKAFDTTIMKFYMVDLTNGDVDIYSYDYIVASKDVPDTEEKVFVKVYKSGGTYGDFAVVYKK